MELKELAKQLGVKNILVSHYNNDRFYNQITVIINDDLVMNVFNKKVEFIPLSKNGINKEIETKVFRTIIHTITDKLDTEKVSI